MSDETSGETNDEREAAEPAREEAKETQPSGTPEGGSPEGRELREAEVAFEVGDYRRCRELASKLAASPRPAVADAARDLLRRTDVDPVQMVFLALCACALLGVAYYYLGS
jgi:hypothetical protein